jgi:hypothetical protein
MAAIVTYWNMFCNFFAWYIFAPLLCIWFVYMLVMCLAPRGVDHNQPQNTP